jgi:DNA-binding transcriptional ArsR family regulator
MDPRAFSAVASERRRDILRLLWQTERSAGDLAAHFDISWPAVSQHLGVLKDAGLIREKRDGRNRFYIADENTLGPLQAVLTQMWTDDLDRLAHLAESEEGPPE